MHPPSGRGFPPAPRQERTLQPEVNQNAKYGSVLETPARRLLRGVQAAALHVVLINLQCS